MRSPFSALLSIQFRQYFTRSFRRDNASRTKSYGALTVVALLFVVGYYVLLFATLVPGLVHPTDKSPTGMSEQTFTIVTLGVQLLCLLFGTYQLLSVVFMAKDLPVLAAMPFSPRALFMTKLMVVYVYELVTALLLALPLGVYIGLYYHHSLFYYIKLLISVLLMPAFPLALGALLCLLFMRVSLFVRHRDAFVIMLSLAFLLLYLIGYGALNSGMNRDLTAGVNQLSYTLTRITTLWPPATWVKLALFRPAAMAQLHLLYFSLLSTVSLYGVVQLAVPLYLKSALSVNETTFKQKARRHTHSARHSPFLASVKREFSTLLRTPVYFMNTFITVLIFPLMLFLMRNPNSSNASLGLALEQLRQNVNPAIIIAVLTGILTLCGGLSNAAYTPFSREGRYFMLLRAYPMTLQTQVRAKLFCSYLISLLTQAATGVTLLVLYKLPFDIVAASLALSLFGVLPLQAAAMVPDCTRPKLRWTTESQAMKNNLNALLGMGTQVIAATVAGLVIYWLCTLSLPLWLFLLAALLWLALLSTVALTLLTNYNARQLQKIEL